MTTTSDNPIEALRARVAALPEGPHEVQSFAYAGDIPEEVAAWVPTLATVPTSDGDMESQPTAETVAAVLNVMPELLAVVDVLRRAVKAHQAARTQGDLMAVLDALTDGPAALDALVAKIREVLR